jgi:hypothetical protein
MSETQTITDDPEPSVHMLDASEVRNVFIRMELAPICQKSVTIDHEFPHGRRTNGTELALYQLSYAGDWAVENVVEAVFNEGTEPRYQTRNEGLDALFDYMTVDSEAVDIITKCRFEIAAARSDYDTKGSDVSVRAQVAKQRVDYLVANRSDHMDD